MALVFRSIRPRLVAYVQWASQAAHVNLKVNVGPIHAKTMQAARQLASNTHVIVKMVIRASIVNQIMTCSARIRVV